MAGGGSSSSSSGGGTATLQRSKTSAKQKVQTAPKLDDGYGGGGIGKGVFFGGGGGDDGGDDDDDYIGGGGGDDEGGDDGFFRHVLAELYDAQALGAVLQEWYRGLTDLPFVLRQAVQMGMISSAALVRFMTLDVRPSVARAVTRALPASISREVVGRLMADPAFLHKLVLEQLVTAASSIVYQKRQRGSRFWSELDLVLADTACLLVANAAVVYLVAPTRAAPVAAPQPWRNALARLPNSIFDPQQPLRSYTPQLRALAFAVKCAELCGVGLLAGSAQSVLGNALCGARRVLGSPDFKPALEPRPLRESALGFAAAWGLFANCRYQAIAGVDTYLFEHANYLWTYLLASGVLRAGTGYVADNIRLSLQGARVGKPARPVGVLHDQPGATTLSSRATRARATLQNLLKSQHEEEKRALSQAPRSKSRQTKRAQHGSKGKRSPSSRGFEMGIGAAA